MFLVNSHYLQFLVVKFYQKNDLSFPEVSIIFCRIPYFLLVLTPSFINVFTCFGFITKLSILGERYYNLFIVTHTSIINFDFIITFLQKLIIIQNVPLPKKRINFR